MTRFLLLSTLVVTACAGLEEDTLDVTDDPPADEEGAPTGSAPYVGTANDWFFEIDGDYQSVIDNRVANDGGHNQSADEVTDGVVTTWGNRDMVNSIINCTNWTHTASAPYMGTQAYRVSCVAPANPNITPVRSEQHFVSGWRPGEDSARSLSLAVRLTGVPAIPTVAGGGFLAQVHGDGLPFVLRWAAVPGVGYRLQGEVRYDGPVQWNPTLGKWEFPIYQPIFYDVPLTPGTWNRVMVQIDLRRSGTGECPDTIGDQSTVSISRMDNTTGLWDVGATWAARVGNKWDHETGGCASSSLDYNFKVGQYVVYTSATIDYDNISYGKRWSNITKNRLIGYQKSVLRLPFEETSGITVQDRSYTWNGGSAGDPISDYNNDGAIVGGVTRISTGINGRALHFPGTTNSYVNVPINAAVTDDFDVGNYMTVSTWFRTTSTPTTNKGLVMIDEFSTSWKLLLYMRGDGIAFGVRHPGTYSRLDHLFTRGRYADNQWHLVTGTYNRFAADGQRIKLYIDGRKVMEAAGSDLPVLRGDNQLVVGKYSVDGFFRGDIDDVGLHNYAMTDQDVDALWRRRATP